MIFLQPVTLAGFALLSSFSSFFVDWLGRMKDVKESVGEWYRILISLYKKSSCC